MPIVSTTKSGLLPDRLLLLAIPALTLSSISTLAAGLVWLLFSLAGMTAWIAHKKIHAVLPITAQAQALRAARWWLLTCIAALALMSIPTAYWGGPWPERHPQWRLLIAASGLWLLLRHHATRTITLYALATSAALSLILGLFLVILKGAIAAPTNRLPWVAGLSLLSCTLLCLSYRLNAAPIWLRRLWWLASCSSLVTVLISGVRGSWLLLLVWPMGWFFLQRADSRLFALTLRRGMFVLLTLPVIIAAGNALTPEHDRPWTRLVLIIQESGLGSSTSIANNNSSVGVRLGLYKAGIQQVSHSPSWLGIGHAEHKAKIHGHLQDMGWTQEMAQGIGHYHSDWLNPWAEFGVLGLLGYLSYPAGLIVLLVMAVKSRDRIFAVGIASVLIMHISTGMTNANFAHNYYPVLLSLCISLLILSQAIPPSPAPAIPNPPPPHRADSQAPTS